MEMEIEENYLHNQDPLSLSGVMRRCLLAKNKLATIIKGPSGEIQYCCVQCPVRCTEKDSMEQHLTTHNNEYRHLCGICGTGLKRKEHLDRHTLEHQQVRPHVCEICFKAFKRKEHLNIHKSIHSGDKNEVCMLCHKSFYRKDHLQKHLQTHSKVFIEQNATLGDHELVGVKAEVMELSASDRFDDSSQDGSEHRMEDIEILPDQGPVMMEEPAVTLEEPIVILQEPTVILEEPTKPKELRPYACDICDKTYKRKDHLKLHTQSHINKKECSECGRAFVSDEKLLQHMNMHLHAYSIMNGDEDKTHLHALLAEHNIDPSFLQTDNNLLVPRMYVPHDIDSQAGDAARRHECAICHRKFKRRQHLLAHQNVHNKNQPNIWCGKCNEGFFTNESFESHQCVSRVEQLMDLRIEQAHSPPPAVDKKENEHPHINILPAECPSDTQYLISDESRLPTPRRVFVCRYCRKHFKRKDHYKIHLHIHTGLKSFFCTECGRGFYRKDHLQKHMIVHTKAKPTATAKPKKAIPDLFPINKLPKKDKKEQTSFKKVFPEITIHAPSNTKLRVPLQIKVPYQVVMSMENGEERAVTIDPTP